MHAGNNGGRPFRSFLGATLGCSIVVVSCGADSVPRPKGPPEIIARSEQNPDIPGLVDRSGTIHSSTVLRVPAPSAADPVSPIPDDIPPSLGHSIAVAQTLTASRAPSVPADSPVNVALGKPYIVEPAPNYPLCLSPHDDEKLTDGVYTEGCLWLHTSTMGWTGNRLVSTTIDLRQRYPITGALLSTASGDGGVHLPAAVYTFISDDNRNWHYACDLFDFNTELKVDFPSRYTTTKLSTQKLHGSGRYIKFIVETSLSTGLFIDEIEVYTSRTGGGTVSYPEEFLTIGPNNLRSLQGSNLVKTQLLRDLYSLKKSATTSPSDLVWRSIVTEWEALHAKVVSSFFNVFDSNFKAILPMNALEADIFHLQARAWRLKGLRPLTVWHQHRWDPLDPNSEPNLKGERNLSIHSMIGEYRSECVNITNSSDNDITIHLRVVDLPPYAKCHISEILCTGTRCSQAVNAAMKPLEEKNGYYSMLVPAGMTRQAWISLYSDKDVSNRTINIQVTSGISESPISLGLTYHVYPIRVPAHTSLSTSGWDYTNPDSEVGIDNTITHLNRIKIIEFLKTMYTNTTWATADVWLKGMRFSDNHQLAKIDTTSFDAWVRDWAGAKQYIISFGYYNNFIGIPIDNPEFKPKVEAWIRFWQDHILRLGLKPSQFAILITDEATSVEQHRGIAAYAKVIHSAAPGIRVFSNPTPHSPGDPVDAFSVSDILCANADEYIKQGAWYQNRFEDQRKRGKEFWFYSCSTPARNLDPLCYYLLQPWICYKFKATGSAFWSYCDYGDSPCWNEYASNQFGPSSPAFIDVDQISGSKYTEAIREGILDYRYLELADFMINNRSKRGFSKNDLDLDRRSINSIVHAILLLRNSNDLSWTNHRDAHLYDVQRIALLQLLYKLNLNN